MIGMIHGLRTVRCDGTRTNGSQVQFTEIKHKTHITGSVQSHCRISDIS